MKLPKFLLAFDRDFMRKFIIHTQTPIAICEAIENDIEVLIVEETDNERKAGLTNRVKDWYKSVNKKDFAPPTKDTFLLSVDPINNELYILHRNFPACLIWVKQEIPMRFVIQDLYDEVENNNEILNMPFVQAAKDFFKKYSESIMGGKHDN